MRSIVPAVLTVTSLLGSARAETDSLDDMLGPREIAVGDAMRGGATGASAIGLNPAGLPLNRELVFEGGYGYREADDASLINVSACDSTNAMPGCFFYDYAGSNPELEGMTGSRRTHVAGMALSKQILPRVMLGTTTKYYDFESDMTGETSHSGFVFDLGGTVRLTEMINFGVAAQNLFASEKSPHFPRAVGGGFHARPMDLLAVSFDARWRLDGDQQQIRYGGGAELFLRGSRGQTGYPVRIGGLRDNGLGTSYVTGGIGMANLKWSIDIGARREVKGGDDTLILASMRFYGPRMAAPMINGGGGGGDEF
ncbi:MAG: hypothetical protein H0T89_10700 [Deltaproteobacteria bacterium]|nr:hypothetical protein [Deltaproteobacteria bacterium]MDQ3297691.1 hypothetical protein [Myxococcota bacterium]